MIRSSESLQRFAEDYARERIGSRSYEEALAIFTALWTEAASLNPGFPGDWREDLEPDLAVARAVNGLEPTT